MLDSDVKMVVISLATLFATPARYVELFCHDSAYLGPTSDLSLLNQNSEYTVFLDNLVSTSSSQIFLSHI